MQSLRVILLIMTLIILSFGQSCWKCCSKPGSYQNQHLCENYYVKSTSWDCTYKC